MATKAGNRRTALAVVDARSVLEGAGVPIRRVLPTSKAPYEMVDPFLLLDEGRMHLGRETAGFPVHPHRGFEIVTYSLRGPLSQTQISDGKKETAQVAEGGLLRITAGRGMAHGEGTGELPPEGQEVHILQLWINLARAEKQVEPSYQVVAPADLPRQKWGDADVRVLVGEGAPTRLRTPAMYVDVALPAGGTVDIPVPEGWQGFAYLLDGEGVFGSDGKTAKAGQLVVLGPGGVFPVAAQRESVHFVLAAGRPYKEQPRWNGSFVD